MLETIHRGAGWLLAILFASLQWLALLVVRVVLILVGLPIVAIAIPFARRRLSISDGRPILNLPRWAWLVANDYDGLLGDKRLWWRDNCDALVLFGLRPLLRRLGVALDPLPVDSWLACFWWAAIRNPVNNLRLVTGFNCPVSECVIRFLGDAVVEDKPSYSGWQFVAARHAGGRSRWYGFYLVHQWNQTRAFVLRLGYKIKPEHEGSDEPGKGMTFKVNPFKAI